MNAIIRLTLDLSALPSHTYQQLDEWVRFEVGESNSIRMNNPLIEEDFKGKVDMIKTNGEKNELLSALNKIMK